MIRPLLSADIPDITAIYNHYIAHTVVTFDTTLLTPADMQARLDPILTRYPAYVAIHDGRVAGYCYAHPWKGKDAYRHTAETTIYVDPQHHRQGYGRQLMAQLIDQAPQYHLHVLIACITLPNPASIALHQQIGFEQVSHFTAVGRKFDRWLDVADFQLTLAAR